MSRAAGRVIPPSSNTAGYTLIEMFVTVAALVIVLGLMVSLARYLRNRSGEVMTRAVLVRLDELMARYLSDQQAFPPVPSVHGADEYALQRSALANNQAFAAALKRSGGVESPFSDIPVSLYDGQTVRDSWRRPIVFVPPGVAAVGILPQNRYFFYSAGPDRKY